MRIQPKTSVRHGLFTLLACGPGLLLVLSQVGCNFNANRQAMREAQMEYEASRVPAARAGSVHPATAKQAQSAAPGESKITVRQSTESTERLKALAEISADEIGAMMEAMDAQATLSAQKVAATPQPLVQVSEVQKPIAQQPIEEPPAEDFVFTPATAPKTDWQPSQNQDNMPAPQMIHFTETPLQATPIAATAQPTAPVTNPTPVATGDNQLVLVAHTETAATPAPEAARSMGLRRQAIFEEPPLPEELGTATASPSDMTMPRTITTTQEVAGSLGSSSQNSGTSSYADRPLVDPFNLGK